MDANSDKGPRVVLVHDWLTGMRGGEKCLEVLCRRWPHARLFTLLHRRGSVSAAIERLQPRTSFLNCLPENHRYYRYLLPLMPAAVTSWRLPPCDLVVSFSHCVAKAIRPRRIGTRDKGLGTREETWSLSSLVPSPLSLVPIPHVCYCFTPMRYAWHMQRAYFGADRVGGVKARALERVLGWLRQWDRRTADGVTHFLAISETVQRRIAECYGRSSTVIYPPVDTDFYHPAALPREEFYLAVSAFAPYKRLDLAIQACNALRRPLLVIGAGQDEARLRAGGTDDSLSRLAARHGYPRPPAPLPRSPFPRRGGLWHRAGGSAGVRRAGDRLRPGRRHRDGHPSRSPPRADRHVVRRANRRVAGGDARLLRGAPSAFSPSAARRQALRFNAPRFADELFTYLDNVLQPSADSTRRRAA